MQISVNNLPVTVPPACTVQQLLTLQNISGNMIAVASAQEIIPRHEWPYRVLTQGEKITIIGATKGG